MVNAIATSAPGCSLMLYIHRDGTYTYWERDSLGDNLLCHGTFKADGKDKRRGLRAMNVEFEGWPAHEHQLITFHGPGEFSTYPGGYRIGRVTVGPPTDAGTDTYVRAAMKGEPRVTRGARESGGRLRHQPIMTTPEGEILKAMGRPPGTPANPDSTR